MCAFHLGPFQLGTLKVGTYKDRATQVRIA